ncbi:MAG: DNA replication and repair protein RecF [Bacteroidota bacterium]|nr:MAG: DNA replication and repair protein RecF [Bacteroidota bacterium]
MSSLRLNALHITHYKNVTSAEYQFEKPIHCFVGNNGKGKTNTLDAIYHLAMGRSYFSPINAHTIMHDKAFMRIKGHFKRDENIERIECQLKREASKAFIRNGKKYNRLSEHIGLLPIVMISPADVDLINEGSQTRRSFIDKLIGQADSVYLQQLIQYQKILQQRNALLKQMGRFAQNAHDTLSIYNEQLVQLGTPIHRARTSYLAAFEPLFQKRYATISRGNEGASLVYESQLKEGDFSALLEAAASKDQHAQFSTVGIHKDDLAFQIDGYPIKKFGSQGQRKSFLIALKLAQFDMLKKSTAVTPLLLLDDIFDKLDEQRVAEIINLVHESSFGQLFITDTHPERTADVIKQTEQPFELHQL